MTNFVLELGKQASSLGVSAVYGETRQLGDVEIVPVALSWSGFGGAREGEGAREAGGGGATAVPIGAYAHRDGEVRFEPNLIALLAVGIPFVCVTGRALSRVIRALKK